MILRFTITNPLGDSHNNYNIRRLDLKWDFPLRKDGPAQKALRKALEGLHGVEWLDLTRYSCGIGYAGHVVTSEDLALDIQETLEDDKELLHMYNQFEAKPEFGAGERIEVEVSISL